MIKRMLFWLLILAFIMINSSILFGMAGAGEIWFGIGLTGVTLCIEIMILRAADY